jgi:hypothetical protein
MASTRNRNSPGDYHADQNGKIKQSEYLTYVQSGKPDETMFPGNGLLTGRIGPTELSRNTWDIESFLFGIGSTNLVEPKEPPVAEIKYLKSLNIMDKLPVIVPNPLVVEPNQRPLWK